MEKLAYSGFSKPRDTHSENFTVDFTTFNIAVLKSTVNPQQILHVTPVDLAGENFPPGVDLP